MLRRSSVFFRWARREDADGKGSRDEGHEDLGAEFGKKVFYKPLCKDVGKLEPRWEYGAFVGVVAGTNEIVLGVDGGDGVKERAMRRLAEGDRWGAQLAQGARKRPAGFELRTHLTAGPENEAPAEFPQPKPETIPPFLVRHQEIAEHGLTSSCKEMLQHLQFGLSEHFKEGFEAASRARSVSGQAPPRPTTRTTRCGRRRATQVQQRRPLGRIGSHRCPWRAPPIVCEERGPSQLASASFTLPATLDQDAAPCDGRGPQAERAQAPCGWLGGECEARRVGTPGGPPGEQAP